MRRPECLRSSCGSLLLRSSGLRLGVSLSLSGGLLLRRLLTLLLLAHMVADRAAGGSASQAVMAGNVTSDTADQRAFQAAGAGDTGDRSHGESERQGDQFDFHDDCAFKIG